MWSIESTLRKVLFLQQQEQLKSLKSHLDEEVAHHESEIKRHQQRIKQLKEKTDKLDK